jgi:hypothetical protein
MRGKQHLPAKILAVRAFRYKSKSQQESRDEARGVEPKEVRQSLRRVSLTDVVYVTTIISILCKFFVVYSEATAWRCWNGKLWTIARTKGWSR